MPYNLFYGIEDRILGLLTERYNNLLIVYLVTLQIISAKLLIMKIVRTEPNQCWAFVIVCSSQGRSTVSERYHPEMGHIPSRLQLLLQPFLLVFVASKHAEISLLELTRTMVRLHFKFCYFSLLSDFSSMQSLTMNKMWEILASKYSMLRKT